MGNTMLFNQERPDTFAKVGGNEHISTPLANMVARGTWRNGHFIFSGFPGTGKTTLGRILARAINCTDNQKGEPCNKCKNCVAHLNEDYKDYLELDATSYNKVEDAKRLVELANTYPINPKGQRIILLDEAHVLSNAAFDKFLKYLESANTRTTFIFCTTDLHLFRNAIVSRCFPSEVLPLPSSGIAKELTRICKSNGFEYDPITLNKMSHHFAGKPRDAVKTLDFLIKTQGHANTYQDVTQESIILACLKFAFHNKIEEYLDLVEKVDGNNLFRNLSRTLNEIFLYPHIHTDLLTPKEIESFKVLIDNQNLKVIIRDVIQLKPDTVHAFILLLATISELGLKLSTKAEKQSHKRGRRFVDNKKSDSNEIVSMQDEPEAVMDIEEDEPLEVIDEIVEQAIDQLEEDEIEEEGEAVDLDDELPTPKQIQPPAIDQLEAMGFKKVTSEV